MPIKNSTTSYGWLAITFHWVSAIVIIGLYAVGLWMTDLNYYSEWYRTAPHWHKSVGILLVAFMAIRWGWRAYNPAPAALSTHQTWEVKIGHLVHIIFYVLVISMLVSGYFITTAQGQGLEVFDWFELPATVTGIDNLEDLAGQIHELTGHFIILLVIMHVAAALKHHFKDKDKTLLRMFGRG